MKIFLLTGLLLWVHFLPAQALRDSLQKQLASFTSIDTNYIKTLYLLAYQYQRNNDDTMLIMGQKVISLSDSLEYTAGISMGFRTLCNYYGKFGEIEKANQYGERAAQIADSIHRPFLKAQALTSLAGLFERTNPTLAIEYITEALSVFKEFKDEKWEGIAYQSLGTLYREMNNWDKSIEAHQKALDLFIKTRQGSIPGQYINLGNTYMVKGEVQPDSALAFQDYEMAQMYMEKALEEFEKSQEHFGMDVTAVNLGA